MDIREFLPTLIASACGGLAAYVAIRVDLAVLKLQALHNKERADNAHELASDAHDRLNKLRALRERDTL